MLRTLIGLLFSPDFLHLTAWCSTCTWPPILIPAPLRKWPGRWRTSPHPRAVLSIWLQIWAHRVQFWSLAELYSWRMVWPRRFSWEEISREVRWVIHFQHFLRYLQISFMIPWKLRTLQEQDCGVCLFSFQSFETLLSGCPHWHYLISVGAVLSPRVLRRQYFGKGSSVCLHNTHIHCAPNTFNCFQVTEDIYLTEGMSPRSSSTSTTTNMGSSVQFWLLAEKIDWPCW